MDFDTWSTSDSDVYQDWTPKHLTHKYKDKDIDHVGLQSDLRGKKTRSKELTKDEMHIILACLLHYVLYLVYDFYNK